ncbi:hypothetical protein [Bradyrhizobium cenepequi]
MRVHERVRRPIRKSGLLLRLRFKLPLPFFKIYDTLRQRLILLAQLFGLNLDVRKLIGMTGRRKGTNRRRRYKKRLFHERPSKRNAAQPAATKSRSFG